jgi:hypothetical protein
LSAKAAKAAKTAKRFLLKRALHDAGDDVKGEILAPSDLSRRSRRERRNPKLLFEAFAAFALKKRN